MKWIKTTEVEPPDLPTTGKTIIGCWVEGNEIYIIDHLAYVHGDYWNQNSANMTRQPDYYFVVPELEPTDD